MPMRKIVSGLRIDSANPTAKEYELPETVGGSQVKSVTYVIVPLQSSASTDDLTLKIEQSPDGALWGTHTDYPALADVSTMQVYNSSTSVILGEHFRGVIKTSTTASQWFVVDVYEITRRF